MKDEPVAQTFSHFTDLMDDEALSRYRASVFAYDGHERASLNYNSLRRIIARLDKAEAALATRPADDLVRQLVEALGDSTEHMAAVFANKDLLTDRLSFIDAFAATMEENRVILARAQGYGG